MKILSIDYGESKIGLAISDETASVSARLPILFAENEDQKIRGVINVLKTNLPEIVVVGVSSNLNGEVSKIGIRTREYIQLLKQKISIIENLKEIKFIEWDETYSTKNAEIGRSKKYKHNNSDSEAARLILQEFLDSPDGLNNLLSDGDISSK